MSRTRKESEGVILVMGPTGAGKSYFINKLKRGGAQVGHSLRAETTRCQGVNIEFGSAENTRVITVVDTPGFDDTHRSSAEVLSEITEYLATQHAMGIPTKGVLYLHRILDNRMSGSAMTSLGLFQDIVGDSALKNVILVTTMWNKLRAEDIAEADRREQELLDDFWRPMIDNGSFATQFRGTSDKAAALVYHLAEKQSVVLKVQEEAYEQEKAVVDTSAGANLNHSLQEDEEKYKKRLRELERRLRRQVELGDKERQRIVRREIAAVEAVLKRLSMSLDHLADRQGSRARIRRWYRETSVKIQENGVGMAFMALAAVFNITVSVVRLVGGV
ncbi:hypothetical protein LRP88_03393 [Fusarium phalaenopsidis]|nr:AIG1-type G domain-containing protein [Fusarium sp. Ph1]